MALDGNYSTINANNIFYNIDDAISSRLLVNIPIFSYETGITAGNVIRWDTVGRRYVKSIAIDSVNSEVFGIVESIQPDSKSLNVVISGSINISPTSLINNTTTENLGENDIYFLSSTTAGALENIGPSSSGLIIKPLYYKAPHGSFTGLVRNYLGYKGNTDSLLDPTPVFVTFSEDMSKILEYSDLSKQFYIYSANYSNNIFRKTRIFFFNKADLENNSGKGINFNLVSNTCEAKISNDGTKILLLNKSNKEIYYISIDASASASLKYTLNVDLAGNPEDILWSCDNELTCFAISSRSLTRPPSPYDSRITAFDICSRIKYYRRNVNSSFPDKWKKIHEQPAFGFCDADNESTPVTVDSIRHTPAIYRTSDIKCKNKNFSVVTNCLVEDQIAYNSKKSGETRRYVRLLDNIKSRTKEQVDSIRGISGSDVDITITGGDPFNAIAPLSITGPTLYHCGFGLKNFNILNKNTDNFYYENNSFRSPNGIRYFDPIQMATSAYNGVTLAYSQRKALTSYTFSGVSRETQLTKTYTTNNFIFSCTIYNILNSSFEVVNKEFHVFKFPFNSNDNITVFRYFEDSSQTSSLVPSSTNTGLILKMDISSDPVNFFEFFGTDDRFFICQNNKVLVKELTSGILNTINVFGFDKAKFWSNSNGDFFLVDGNIKKYNTTTKLFDLQEIA